MIIDSVAVNFFALAGVLLELASMDVESFKLKIAIRAFVELDLNVLPMFHVDSCSVEG
jgi:hypothetical protein